jgi:hypothetical protein
MTWREFLDGNVPSNQAAAVWLRDQLCDEHIRIEGLLCSDDVEAYETWIEENAHRETQELLDAEALRLGTLGELFGRATERTIATLGAQGHDVTEVTTTLAIKQSLRSGRLGPVRIEGSDDTLDSNSTDAEIDAFIDAYGDRYPWEWLPSPNQPHT